MNTDRRHHTLYRFFGQHHELLYVGITASLPTRLSRHRGDKPWWAEVDHITVEHFPNRVAVLKAETVAIQTERPRYNKQQNRPAVQQRRSATDFFPPLHLARKVASLASSFVSIPIEDPRRQWYHRRINVRRADQRVEITLDRDRYVDWCRHRGADPSIPPGFVATASRAIDIGVETLRRLGVEDDFEIDVDPDSTPAAPRWITLHLVPAMALDGAEALYEAEALGEFGLLEGLAQRLELAASDVHCDGRRVMRSPA